MLKTVAALCIAMFALIGCNTMEGAGEDIQRGGEKLENAADRNK